MNVQSLGNSLACKEIKPMHLSREVGSYVPIPFFFFRHRSHDFFITSEINIATDTS